MPGYFGVEPPAMVILLFFQKCMVPLRGFSLCEPSMNRRLVAKFREWPGEQVQGGSAQISIVNKTNEWRWARVLRRGCISSC
jgi:hypothetical protein